MSELLDQQMNVQKEGLKKNFQSSRKLLQAHEKCVIKMKDKNDARIKILLMEGSSS